MRYSLVALLCIFASVTRAADFSIESIRGGDYVLVATGELHRGDAQRLENIFIGKGAFPISTRINTQGGEADTAMALGRLYRQAGIATLTDGRCDTTCFLWLVAGGSRAANGEITLAGKLLSQRDVADYLIAMDIDDATLNSWQQVTELTLSPAGFDESLGERPTSIKAWLRNSCGEQTAQQRENFRILQAEGFLTALKRLAAQRDNDSQIETLIARYEALASKADQLSDNDKLALQEHWLTLQSCRKTQLEIRQAKQLDALTADSSAQETP